MYRREEFKTFFRAYVSLNPDSLNSYVSTLNAIDRGLGGLDGFMADRSPQDARQWMLGNDDPPFDRNSANRRTAFKRYLDFLEGQTNSEMEEEEAVIEPDPSARTLFRLEKEMQSAVRRQLPNMEVGLREVDDGIEVRTQTGRTDIVARDCSEVLVVIELKAGACPPGALEQVLGYAQSLSVERGERVRAILVASSFSDRIRAAAQRASDVLLFTYDMHLSFSPSS